MTEKELRRLSRTELLERLLEETRRSEALAAELEEAQAALTDRKIQIERSGTLAEAALSISGVLKAADEAARLYLENLRAQDDDPEGLQARMLANTEARCREMREQAARDSQAYWERISRRLTELAQGDPALQRALLRAVQEETTT